MRQSAPSPNSPRASAGDTRRCARATASISSPICAVSLTDQATGDDTFVMTVKPGCDQSITRFGPISWVLDRGDIIWFSAKGERLRFGRQQEGGWAKVPDTPRPLLLARP